MSRGSLTNRNVMNSIALGLRTAATIFGLVCLAQLIRLFSRADIVIAGHDIPLWPSAFAAIVTGGLSIWLWRLGSRHSPHGNDRPTAA
jgi:hypothetical protein